MNVQPEIQERPIGGPAKGWLTFRAAWSVFLFYALAGASILFLTGVVVLEFAVGFGGRFRWALAARRALRAHFGLLKTLARGLCLPKTAAARIPLPREEAEELFIMIENLCLQTGIAAPRQIWLEMQMNAWVRLEGSRRVVLGVGYDLLAGLTRAELQAVLAHELTHAKVTRWTIQNRLARGLERAAQISRMMARATPPRRQGRAPFLSRSFSGMFDGLAESAAHWIAAASRQEEFAADRGAAELCGSAIARATLVKVESLSQFTAKLAWRERVAQLQGHAFSAWLARELASVKMLDPREIAAELPNRFSTHPSLRDRLNAFPVAPANAPESDSRPALELLPQADAVAEQLMARIHQTAIEQEEHDSAELRKWAKKMRTATEMRPAQVCGAAMVAAAEIAGAVAWITGATLDVVTIIFIVTVLGMLVYWLGRFREGFVLPVPDFGLLKATWPSEPDAKNEALKNAEERKQQRTLGRSLKALQECNYAEAEVAARLCLKSNPESAPALLVSAISGAWLGKGREVSSALSALQQTAGLRGFSICWGAAWTYMLRGNWARAEALLQQTLSARPNDPTLLNLRALCQLRRGKIQSAIISSRRACQPRPINREHAKFLIDLLLEGGYLREAQEHLLPLDEFIRYDAELMLTAIRLNLLLRDIETANHWAELLLNDGPPPYVMVRMGVIFELARQPQQAARFYREALARAYFPDACLGLARLDAETSNFAAARQHALSALNCRRALGRFATPPLELLGPILLQLAALEPPTRFCRAWIAALGLDTVPTVLAGRSFMVYATTQAQAERYLRTFLEAMASEAPRVQPVHVGWRLGPPEHQPVGLAHPGVRLMEGGGAPFREFQRRGLWQTHYSSAQRPVEAPLQLAQCA